MIKVSLERRFMEARLLRALEGLKSTAREFYYINVEYQDALKSREDDKAALILEVKERLDGLEQSLKEAREEYEIVLERAYIQYLGRP